MGTEAIMIYVDNRVLHKETADIIIKWSYKRTPFVVFHGAKFGKAYYIFGHRIYDRWKND